MSIYLLANDYYQGLGCLQEDSDRAKELLTRAADGPVRHIVILVPFMIMGEI